MGVEEHDKGRQDNDNNRIKMKMLPLPLPLLPLDDLKKNYNQLNWEDVVGN